VGKQLGKGGKNGTSKRIDHEKQKGLSMQIENGQKVTQEIQIGRDPKGKRKT